MSARATRCALMARQLADELEILTYEDRSSAEDRRVAEALAILASTADRYLRSQPELPLEPERT